MTRSRWIIFAVICLGLLGFLVYNSKKDSVDVSSIDTGAIITSGEGQDHVYGNADAKVVMFEYGDFQCAGCGAAYPQLKALKEEYKDQMAFVYRNMPLTSIHPNALAAAATAGAAAKQGKFWEMHDKLYDNRTAWEYLAASQRSDVFAGYAQDLGLNVDQFKSDLTAPEVTRKIAVDRAIAAKLGVTATPTLYIGNEKMPDNVISDLTNGDGKLLREKIEAAIVAAGGTLPKKTEQ